MNRDRLLNIIHEKSLLKGTYVLSSGGISDYYVDLRRTTLDGEGATLIGMMIWNAIKGDNVNCVGGMSIGADPIATATAMTSWMAGQPIAAFIVRKQIKDHGTRCMVEGPVVTPVRAAIVDDVCSTGYSAVTAAATVMNLGGTVERIVSVVDRNDGAKEYFSELGIPYTYIFTLEEILEYQAK